MLDVGTGVAAMAVAYAQVLPQVTVVGIEVLSRVLALAVQTVAASDVADRVELRQQDISELQEEQVYALAWLPATFVPELALREGAARAMRALVPGGWLMMGHGKYGDNEPENELNRSKTVAFGGTALDDRDAQQLLTEAGSRFPSLSLRRPAVPPSPLAAPRNDESAETAPLTGPPRLQPPSPESHPTATSSDTIGCSRPPLVCRVPR